MNLLLSPDRDTHPLNHEKSTARHSRTTPAQSHIIIFKRHSQTRAGKVKKNPKETKAERIRKPPPPGDLRSTSVSPLLQRHLPELQHPAARLGAQASLLSLRSHAYRLQQRLLRSPISPFLSAPPRRSAVAAMEDNFTVGCEEIQLNRFRFGPISPAERA